MQMNMHRRSLTVALVIGIFVGLPVLPTLADPSRADEDRIRDFLSSGYRDAACAMENVEIRYGMQLAKVDEDWWKSRGSAGPAGPAVEYCFVRSAGKERLDVFRGDAMAMTYVSDGHYRLGYYPTKGTGDSSTQVGRAERTADARGLIATNLGPVKSLGYKAGVLPDDILEDPESRIEHVPADDTRPDTYKVTARVIINRTPYDVSYWLCPERNALPVRWEVRETSGQLIRLAEVKEFIQQHDGRYFIKEVVEKDIIAGPDGDRVLTEHHYGVTKFSTDPEIEDADFFCTEDRVVPARYLFQDHVSGLEYTIGQGPLSDEVISGIIDETIDEFGNADVTGLTMTGPAEEAESRPLLSDDGFSHRALSETKQTASGPGKYWIVLASVLVVASALGGLAVLLVRGRRRPSSGRVE